MAARLEIEVKQSGGLSGGGSGSAGGLSTADAANITRSLEQANRLTVVMLKGAKDFRAEFAAAAKGLNDGLNETTKQGQVNASRLGLSFQRNLEQAGALGGKAIGKEIEREVGGAFKRGAEIGARQLRTAGGTIAGGFSRFGSESSSAFGAAFSGGILNGNLLRGGLGLAGSVARLGGELGKGLSQAAGAAFNLLPVLGSSLAGVAGLIGSAFSVVGSLAGALTNAAAEIAGAFGDALGTALKVTIGAAVAVGFASVRQALKENDVAGEFTKIAKASGDDAASGLKKLSDATQGTVSNLQLMRLTNLAVREGVASNVEGFGEFAEAARLMGKGVGVDAVQAIEAATRATGQLTGRSFALLGVTLDEKVIFDKLATSLGTTADKLNESQKKTAILAAFMGEAKTRIRDTGVEVNDLSDQMDRFQSSTANAAGKIGGPLKKALEVVATPFNDVIDALGRFIERESGDPGAKLAKGLEGTKSALEGIVAFLDRAKADDIFRLSRDGAVLLFDIVDSRITRLGQRLKLEFEAAVIEFQISFTDAVNVLPFGGFRDFITGDRGAFESDDEVSKRRSAENRADKRTKIDALSAPGNAEDAGFANRAAAIANDIRGIAGRENPASRPTDSRPSSRPSDAVDLGIGNPFEVSGRRPQGPFAPQIDDEGPRPFGAPSFLAKVGSVAPEFVRGAIGNSVSAAGSPDEIAQLGPILEVIAQSILAAKDPANALEAAVDSFADAALANKVDDLGEAIIKPLKDAEKAAEKAARNIDRDNDKALTAFQKANARVAELGNTLADGLAKIDEAFDDKIASVKGNLGSTLANDRANQIGARSNELLSGVGGLGADESGIPVKFKRAAKKVRRAANRERKDSLTSLGQGLSTDELAADGGAQLKSIFKEQATRETAGDVKTAELSAIAEANAKIVALEAERLEAETKLIAEITAKADEQIALMEKSAQGFLDTAESLAATNKQLADVKQRLAAAEKALDAARSALARSSR